MQISTRRFPPLASRKPSQKLKLRPTVVALLAHNASTTSNTIKEDKSLTRDDSLSLRREDVSLRSVTSVRNRSCQLLKGERKMQVGSHGALLERTDIPEVSAKSWMLYELREGRCLYGKRNYKKREMASLTKMMNLITILELVEQFGVNARKVRIRATKNSCAMIGTSAELKQGGLYSLHDLYYGMMLPSGNDAAYLVAEVGGAMLRLMRGEGRPDADVLEDEEELQRLVEGRSNNVSLFLREMNRLSWQLGMTSSNFANPHGLSNTANYSTALDLCKLCAHAMKNPLFRKIVNTQRHHYQCELSLPLEQNKENRDPNQVLDLSLDKSLFLSSWENTNKMLG